MLIEEMSMGTGLEITRESNFKRVAAQIAGSNCTAACQRESRLAIAAALRDAEDAGYRRGLEFAASKLEVQGWIGKYVKPSALEMVDWGGVMALAKKTG